MRKYRSFGETNLKYGIFSKANFERNERKKSDGKFPIKKIQSSDFDRVGRVRGNKLIFNFGLKLIFRTSFSCYSNEKKVLKDDGQQFHQYQQNKQSLLTEHKIEHYM